MLRFSANLRFLFSEYKLADAIRESAKAGFDAVECPWPYQTPTSEIRFVLEETRMPMIVLNSIRGDLKQGDKGLSAIPERILEARSAIDQAVHYAKKINSRNIHIMAGQAPTSKQCIKCFVDNLIYAAKLVSNTEINILIEPLNHRDAPGYFLTTIEQAANLINLTGMKNIKIMFDCYHIQINQGDLLEHFERHKHLVGHIQFSAVHDRGEPNHGEVNYPWLLTKFQELGYSGFFGAEYLPRDTMSDHPTDKGLEWLKQLKL